MFWDDDTCKRGVLIAAAALLLGACSSPLPFLSGEASNQETRQGAADNMQAKSKRTRISSRDIMSEWSTFGLEPWPKRKRVASAESSAPDLLDMPDYTMTIEEIMTRATCRSCEEKPYHQMVVNASNRHGVPAGLIHAVIEKESGYNPSATSGRRARGLMQITPETARFVGIRNWRHLYDPQTNIYAGTAYLKYLMSMHDTVEEVLAAYNSGPGNVRKYNGVPPFKETRRYVRDVKKRYVVISKD